MTLPEESNRAVAATREFLVRLASPYGEGAIKGIRREVRAEALALLRHYPLSWNGDCPAQDNGANRDTLSGSERECLEWAEELAGNCEEFDRVKVLRGLLERL